MVFDPSEPDIDDLKFPKHGWFNSVYGECKEEIPTNIPQPCGFGFKIVVYVDSDHARDTTTRLEPRNERKKQSKNKVQNLIFGLG